MSSEKLKLKAEVVEGRASQTDREPSWYSLSIQRVGRPESEAMLTSGVPREMAEEVARRINEAELA